MKKVIITLSVLSFFAAVALYFTSVQSNTVAVPYEALKGGKLGALNIEIAGEVEKVTGGKLELLYWADGDGIDTIEIKESKYLFHTHYAVVDVQREQTVTYTYTIDNIENGVYDGSATDGTGVVFDSTVIPVGTDIEAGDIVEITFPADDHETFLNFKKLN
jgi:hypothetical protein